MLTVLGAAGVALALVGVGAAVGLGSDGDEGTKGGGARDRSVEGSAKGDPRAARVAQRLDGLPGVAYRGSLTTKGVAVQADLKVTRAGSATGTLTVGGLRADLVSFDGVTYLRAPAAFWRSYGGVTANPGDYDGAWTRTPGQPLDFDLKTLLGPASIAQRLRSAAVGGGTENVAGVPAHKATTSQGDYYFSAADPVRLLRVQSPAKSPAGGPFRFDVTDITTPAGLFAPLRARVGALGWARDPRVRFQAGTLRLVNCNDNVRGCTLELTTSPVGAAPQGGPAKAMMIGSITAGRRTLGGCRAAAPIGGAGKVTLRCTVRGPEWRSWMGQARGTPGRHTYDGHSRAVAQAVAPGDVAGLLAKVDRERPGG